MRADRRLVSVHLTPDDEADLDEILDEIVNGNRHLMMIAAIRAGVAVLRTDPSKALTYLADQRFASRLRLRRAPKPSPGSPAQMEQSA